MKKFIVFVLLLILLCACSHSAPQETTEDENGNTVFSVDEIKELGDYQNTAENYSRYYDEFVGEFIVSEDYGQIYPFIGRRAEGKEGNYTYKEERVGFCTADGEIICDAVFGYRGAYHTDKYTYYLVRLVGTDETYSEAEYLNINAGIFLFIRNDGQKMLEFHTRDIYGTSIQDNRIVIYEDNKKYSYYNEDLEFIETKTIENLKKVTDSFVFNCPGCNEKVTVDYRYNNYIWKKREDRAIGYIHKGCNGKTSVVSIEEKLICTLPQTYGCGIYGYDEDYAWGYYYDSMEYDEEKFTGFIYDRKTDTMYTKLYGSFIVRLDDNKFYYQGQDIETNELLPYIYNVDNESIKYCDGILLSGTSVSYCEAGVSYVKDADLNEIMQIYINVD